MADTEPKPEGERSEREKWLVAAWPGMGNVGVGAAAYLVSKLSTRLVHEIPPRDIFDLQHIEVSDGLAKPGRLPRSMFFELSERNGAKDLLIFLGEAQPQERGFSFARKILDYAVKRDVTHIVTFAAMATQLHPTDDPKVFGAATNGEMIRLLHNLDVTLLKEGEITGLNGVLLAAAAERGIGGLCLLGELPYFAAGVPNPKASKAVLERFCSFTDVDIDFEEINTQAEAVERGLIELLGKLQEAAREQAGEEGLEFQSVMEHVNGDGDDEDDEDGESTPLDDAARRHIESLFEAAEKDRSKAVHLKAELDRLGVFKQFEDRFLDLFQRGE